MLASSDYTTLYRIDNDFLAPASNQFGAIIEQTATDVNASRVTARACTSPADLVCLTVWGVCVPPSLQQSLSSTQLAMSLVVGAYGTPPAPGGGSLVRRRQAS